MTNLTPSELVTEINALGYSVAVRQYNKLKVNNEVLWDATATLIRSNDFAQNRHGDHIHMDEVTFGRDLQHVLGKLYTKCVASAAATAVEAAKQKSVAVDEWGEPLPEEDVFA